MPAERYYLDHPLSERQIVSLEGNEFHHLAHVMRTRLGDCVEIVNGKGSLAEATVKELGKNQALLLIEHVSTTSPSLPRIILAQAIPKPNRLDYIIEKGTELGVDEFWLFPAQHSVKKDFNLTQMERMQTLLISATKQSGRLFLPSLEVKSSVEKWIGGCQGSLFFGDVEKDAPLFSVVWQKLQPIIQMIFLIGPESGFSQKEIDLMKQAHAHGVKLHENILRTDTASLVAVSLVSHWRLA